MRESLLKKCFEMLTILNRELARHPYIKLGGNMSKFGASLGQNLLKNRLFAGEKKIVCDKDNRVLLKYFFSRFFHAHTFLEQLKWLYGILFEYAYLAIQYGGGQLFLRKYRNDVGKRICESG